MLLILRRFFKVEPLMKHHYGRNLLMMLVFVVVCMFPGCGVTSTHYKTVQDTSLALLEHGSQLSQQVGKEVVVIGILNKMKKSGAVTLEDGSPIYLLGIDYLDIEESSGSLVGRQICLSGTIRENSDGDGGTGIPDTYYILESWRVIAVAPEASPSR